MVMFSDTITYPETVVIIFLDTGLTLATMSGTVFADLLAVGTIMT